MNDLSVSWSLYSISESFISNNFPKNSINSTLQRSQCLNICNIKIYKLYCDQVKELIINKKAKIPNLKLLIDKYDNANKLDLSDCQNIKDFAPVSKLERLEILDINSTNISDISFLGRNKNIKVLKLYSCEFIKDFTAISELRRLDILDISFTNISDISFLGNNKSIKELNQRY